MSDAPAHTYRCGGSRGFGPYPADRTSFPFHPGTRKSRRGTLGWPRFYRSPGGSPAAQITQTTARQPHTNHESTLKTDPYTLTQKKFPSYSVPMDAELAALEEKIMQTAALCRQLREENRDLRSQLQTLAADRSRLAGKVDDACARLETLLRLIPE